jgi:DNA (cytosine-5)-methyltransferase 1
MNELALFAGAGGGILGGKLLGWQTVCAVEWEPYPASVLCARQNDKILAPFPIWDDVRTFDGKPWRGIVDVVSGGFPCQDISAAGHGAGISGSRSGLWSEMARIIGEVRPQYAFVENSPMLTSRGLGTVLGDLAALGFDARWGVISAADVGAPHLRERIWIVGHTNVHGIPASNEKQVVQRKPNRTQENIQQSTRSNISEISSSNINGQSIKPINTEKTSIISNTTEIRKQWKPSIQTDRCSGGIIREKNAEITKESSQMGGIQNMADSKTERLQGGGGEDDTQGREITDGSAVLQRGISRNWPTEPDVGRVANGVAARVDRLKAIGNGQVPRVAATAFKLLAGKF